MFSPIWSCQLPPIAHSIPITRQSLTGEHVLPLRLVKPTSTSFLTAPYGALQGNVTHRVVLHEKNLLKDRIQHAC